MRHFVCKRGGDIALCMTRWYVTLVPQIVTIKWDKSGQIHRRRGWTWRKQDTCLGQGGHYNITGGGQSVMRTRAYTWHKISMENLIKLLLVLLH